MKPPKPPHFYPKNPFKTNNFPPSPFFLFFSFFFFTTFLFPKATSLLPTNTPPPEYSRHCNDFVPESPVDAGTEFPASNANRLDFEVGYFTGGDSFFFQPNLTAEAPKSAAFKATYYRKTLYTQIYKIQGELALRIPRSYFFSSSGGGGAHSSPGRGLSRNFRIRGPRIPVIGKGMPRFSLSGYWSESTGRLCMVGSGVSNVYAGKFRTFNVVLKLNYSNSYNVSGSLVSGVMESSDFVHSSSYFQPVSLLGVRSNFENYVFSLVDNGKGSSCWNEVQGEEENLDVSQASGGVCSAIDKRTLRFLLDYGKECDQVNCTSVIQDFKYVPSFMFFKQIKCVDKGKMQILFGFPNSSRTNHFPFDPNTTLIGEGAWDEKNNRVCGVACRVLNSRDSLTGAASVGDCSVKFSLRYPKVLSLRNRDSIVGKFWTDKSEDDPNYFDVIRFRSVWEVSPGFRNVPGLKYEYTEVGSAIRSCTKKNIAKHKGKTYPDGDSIDMRFDMLVTDNKGQSAWGFANPLFVGDQLYQHQPYGLFPSAAHLSSNDSRVLNISYDFSYRYQSVDVPALSGVVEIYTEGIYNRDTGSLCMAGCKLVRYRNLNLMKNYSMDCDIVVSVQFSPMFAAEQDRVKGTIESTRAKSDPLHFGPINFSSKSFYTRQAKESIWRMDLEIIMVLISNTLACAFVGLQLFHVKRHPEVLPFISVVMLILLTLGHMIPLLLNFEALFVTSHNQQRAFLESGGWLEVNEIIVRAVTMVAFLLQFRLLQLTWSVRQGNETKKDLWDAEKKVLFISLPLYVSGGLISWVVHLFNNSHQSPFLPPQQKHLHMKTIQQHFYQQRSFWSDLKSYGGLVLDGFLLPQIMFNILSKSNEKALAASFYMGITLVHLLPHAYDLFRAHSFLKNLGLSYIYADHKMDFYSTAWDITIACGGLLFATFIFLQQRFGGRCFLPKLYREDAVYEKVSVDSSEGLELQGESVQKNLI